MRRSERSGRGVNRLCKYFYAVVFLLYSIITYINVFCNKKRKEESHKKRRKYIKRAGRKSRRKRRYIYRGNSEKNGIRMLAFLKKSVYNNTQI